VRTLSESRAIEEFLEASAAAGDSMAEMRRSVSCEILLHELHELYPLRDLEFFVDQAVAFYQMEATR
jgi:hypothetical protein